MDSSFFKSGLTKPFAQNAEDVAEIPDQKPGFGRASFSSGFPHETSVAIADGGIPPWLMDMNGVLKDISYPIYLMSCGQPVIFNSDFAAAISGYPKGAVVWNNGRCYISNIENNLSDTSNVNAWSIRTPPAASTIDENDQTSYVPPSLIAKSISDILSQINGLTIPKAASQEDVNAGTNEADFVTPLTLANRLSKFITGGQNGDTGWRYELDGTITMWTVSDWFNNGGGYNFVLNYPKPLSVFNSITYSVELDSATTNYGCALVLYNQTLTSVGVQQLPLSSHDGSAKRRVHIQVNGVPA